jgi:hypothetical protein
MLIPEVVAVNLPNERNALSTMSTPALRKAKSTVHLLHKLFMGHTFIILLGFRSSGEQRNNVVSCAYFRLSDASCVRFLVSVSCYEQEGASRVSAGEC